MLPESLRRCQTKRRDGLPLVPTRRDKRGPRPGPPVVPMTPRDHLGETVSAVAGASIPRLGGYAQKRGGFILVGGSQVLVPAG